LSNEEKTNDYENFEKGMIYMKILKKRGVVEKRGEEEMKSMPLWLLLHKLSSPHYRYIRKMRRGDRLPLTQYMFKTKSALYLHVHLCIYIFILSYYHQQKIKFALNVKFHHLSPL
jgi:hypothetical protein